MLQEWQDAGKGGTGNADRTYVRLPGLWRAIPFLAYDTAGAAAG